MRSISRTFSPALVALALALAGCGDNTGTEARPAGGPPALPVDVATPLQKVVTEWDEFTGRFEASRFVEVRARVSGYLKKIHFEDGQIVNKGDLLFTIDRRPFEAQLARTRAELRDAVSAAMLARAELKRTEGLIGTSALSQERLDTRRASREQAEARVAAARANARNAELELEFTEIRAPITGRISDRRIDVGNLVTLNSAQPDVLALLVALDPIYFVFNPSEADYLRYTRIYGPGPLDAEKKAQARVQLQLMDETGWAREGNLDFIDNRIGGGTGTIRVRAVFPNADGFLLPGIFGRVRIAAGPPRSSLLIPDSAIVADQNNRMVMTVDAKGMVVPKQIRPGALVGGLRVIREGLDAGDRVIVNGLQRARPGGDVIPQAAVIKPDGTVSALAPQNRQGENPQDAGR